jgi:toxin ParE1/3/4
VKRRTLVYSQRALFDLEEIGERSEREWGRERTRAYLAAIRETGRKLIDFPAIGTDCAFIRRDLRKRRSGMHLIFYQVMPDEILIVRILHERMAFEYHLTDPST